jgi:predicted kinase
MIIEPDQGYYDAGQYVWTPERRDAAWEDSFARLRQALAAGGIRKVILLLGVPGSGKSTHARRADADDVVVFDGYFGVRARRARALEIARDAGVPVEAVWIDTPLDECLARNDRRSPDRRVPYEVIRAMAAELTADPPTLAEGFAAVTRG